MDWKSILETISSLQHVQSTSLIHSILSRLTDEEKEIFHLALDPTMRYKIRSLPHAPFVPGASSLQILREFAAKPGVGDADAYRLASAIETEEEREVVLKIIRKDLDCGVGLVTARKFITTLPTFGVQLAGRPKDLDRFLKRARGRAFYISPKLDGARCYVIVGDDGVPTYLSRTGLKLKNLSHLDPFFSLFPGAHFDGELMAQDGKFLSLMTYLHRKTPRDTDRPTFCAFDLPSSPAPLHVRYRLLYQMFHEAAPPPEIAQLIPHTLGQEGDIEEAFSNALKSGLEGIMVKDLESIYQHGKRTIDWCKIKPMETITLDVHGVQEGRPGTKYEGMMGALLAMHNGVVVAVGSGFSDEQRREFYHSPPRFIDVSFHHETVYGSLREPRFVRAREDLE